MTDSRHTRVRTPEHSTRRTEVHEPKIDLKEEVVQEVKSTLKKTPLVRLREALNDVQAITLELESSNVLGSFMSYIGQAELMLKELEAQVH